MNKRLIDAFKFVLDIIIEIQDTQLLVLKRLNKLEKQLKAIEKAKK